MGCSSFSLLQIFWTRLGFLLFFFFFGSGEFLGFRFLGKMRREVDLSILLSHLVSLLCFRSARILRHFSLRKCCLRSKQRNRLSPTSMRLNLKAKKNRLKKTILFSVSKTFSGMVALLGMLGLVVLQIKYISIYIYIFFFSLQFILNFLSFPIKS